MRRVHTTRRYVMVVLTLLSLLSAFLLPLRRVGAQSVNNFVINSFKADYYLDRGYNDVAQLKVVEVITATFPEFDQNHGIERALPKTYRGNDVGLSVHSVQKADGSDWAYSKRTQNNNLVLRIGSANTYVHGTQTYVITYTQRNVISFADEKGVEYDHDEWYWDTNGNGWQQPFTHINATVHIPSLLAANLKPDMRCFSGSYGESGTDCTIVKSEDKQGQVITVENTRPLTSGENVSFVLAFNKKTFMPYKPDKAAIVLGAILYTAAFLCIPVVTFVIFLRKWRKYGRDARGRGVIVPQYVPLKDLNPMLSDIVLNENMQTASISAIMLDLCIKSYLKLYEVKKDKLFGSSQEYELELLKQPTDLDETYQKVTNALFGASAATGTRVNLATFKNKLYKDAKILQTQSSQKVAELGYFTSSPELARSKYTVWGVVMLVGGIAPLFIFPPLFIGTSSIAIAGVVILAFGKIMPARTQKGVEAKEYLLGLETYMNLAEKDRIQLLQAPGTAEKINVNDSSQLVKLYEKLLPYAMLFGIEKEWARQFADLYTEAPDWYSGNTAFNTVVFANALSGFNTVTTTSFSAPNSSGSSGFSGGGFSGGGGGGGGGGGW